MLRSFRHRGLRRLSEREDVRRLPADQVERISLVLADLESAREPADMNVPGYRLHRLRGDLREFWSVSISANWRLIFRFEEGDAYDIDLVDYH